MSIKIMQEVWEHAPVDQGALLVLLVLADNADEKSRTCYPGIDTIAKKARLQRRQTVNCLNKLADLGVIEVRRGRSPLKTNLYKIRRPDLWILEAVGGAIFAPPGGALHCTSDVHSIAPKPSVTGEGASDASFFEDDEVAGYEGGEG
jgi:hypothetical protein